MRVFSAVLMAVFVASTKRQMSIEEIDAMIGDSDFWANWDSLKEGTDDEFGEMDVVDTTIPGTPTSATTAETNSDTPVIDRPLLYASLRAMYEKLVSDPLANTESIVEAIRNQTSAHNPYATITQVEYTRNMVLDACTMPYWVHKALLWMVRPNPEFALRFMDAFIHSFIAAYNSGRRPNESDTLLQFRYSMWIRYVLVPFAEDQTMNCETVVGSNNSFLKLKNELLPLVFKDQLDNLVANPDDIMELFHR